MNEPPPPPPSGPPPAPEHGQGGVGPAPTYSADNDPGREVVLFKGVPAAMPIVWVRWLATLGLYEIWRRKTQFVVTNRRIIWRKGLIDRAERSVAISRVQDVTKRKGLLSGWVELSSAGGSEGVEMLGPLWNGSVDRLADAIDRQMH